MLKLSIAILGFNKFNFTKSCLNDLSKLSDDYEVVFVDNGSSDETQKELKDFHDCPNFKYIRNDINLGFAQGNSIAYQNCTAPNVLFLNNDIRIKSDHKNWPERIISSINENPNCLIGPTGGYIDPNKDFVFCYETKDPSKKINYMSGWCLAASKNTWEQLIENDNNGPFLNSFGLAYFEDSDLGFRATKLGIKFKFVDLPIVHFGRVSSKQLNTQKLYTEARNIFIRKWEKNGKSNVS